MNTVISKCRIPYTGLNERQKEKAGDGALAVGGVAGLAKSTSQLRRISAMTRTASKVPKMFLGFTKIVKSQTEAIMKILGKNTLLWRFIAAPLGVLAAAGVLFEGLINIGKTVTDAVPASKD